MAQNKNIPQGYKDSPLGIIPKEWEVKRLGEIGKITSGCTPLRSNLEYHSNGEIYWIKTTDLNNGIIIDTEEKITQKALKETSLKILPIGTVLVAMYGGFNQIGRTGLLGIEATINQALSAILCDKKIICNYYLLSWLNSNVGVWKSFAGSSRKDPNITSKDVADFPFLLPPLPEQQKIAEILSVWDEANEKQTQLIAQLETRKRGLMQQLLTGKKRVKGFSGKWVDKKLAEVGSFHKGCLFSKNDITTKGLFSCIHYGELFTKYREVINHCFSKTNVNTDSLSKEGDLLFPASDVTPAGLGRCSALMLKNVVLGGDIIYLRPNNNYYSPFLSYVINHNKNAIIELVTGIAIKHISASQLKTITLKIPRCFEEQTAIANILSAADTEITLAKQKLANLKEQKKGLMQILLTGKRRVKV